MIKTKTVLLKTNGSGMYSEDGEVTYRVPYSCLAHLSKLDKILRESKCGAANRINFITHLLYCLKNENSVLKEFITNSTGMNLGINLNHIFLCVSTPVKERMFSSIIGYSPVIERKNIFPILLNQKARILLLALFDLDWTWLDNSVCKDPYNDVAMHIVLYV